jgi:hypothetical protein
MLNNETAMIFRLQTGLKSRRSVSQQRGKQKRGGTSLFKFKRSFQALKLIFYDGSRFKYLKLKKKDISEGTDFFCLKLAKSGQFFGKVLPLKMLDKPFLEPLIFEEKRKKIRLNDYSTTQLTFC